MTSAMMSAMERSFASPDPGGKPGVIVTGPDGGGEFQGAQTASFGGVSPIVAVIPAAIGGTIGTLLDYLRRVNAPGYVEIIGKLGIRK